MKKILFALTLSTLSPTSFALNLNKVNDSNCNEAFAWVQKYENRELGPDEVRIFERARSQILRFICRCVDKGFIDDLQID